MSGKLLDKEWCVAVGACEMCWCSICMVWMEDVVECVICLIFFGGAV